MDTQGDRPPSEFEQPAPSSTGRGPITRADRMRARIADLGKQRDAARAEVARLSTPGPDETPPADKYNAVTDADRLAAGRARRVREQARADAVAQATKIEASITALETDLANDPDVKAEANKPIEVGGKLVQKQPDGTYKTVWDPAVEGGPKPIEVGGRIVQQQPGGGYKVIWEPPEKAPTPTAEDIIPEPTAPARAPGQRTDLGPAIEQARLYRNQLIIRYRAKQISLEQMNALYQQHLDQNVRPLQARVQKEINDYADEAARRAARTEGRQLSTEERLARTSEASQSLAEEKYGYEAGRAAVKDAMDLLRYSAPRAFTEDFARALNTVSSGGGPVSFRPEAFQVAMPNLDQIAEAAAHYAARSVPLASRSTAGGVTDTTGAQAAATASLAQTPMLPPPRRSMPGAPGAPTPTPQATPADQVMADQPWWLGTPSGTGAP